jgi:predicted NUDIX family NTP pyrophosphohydrolase
VTSSRTSAGILLWRRLDGRLEVLLGHPGGPFYAKKDADTWSILKGEFDPSEDPVAVARREFEEETGHPAPAGPLLELGQVRQRAGKVVTAWAIEGDLDPAAAVSNTFEMEWPPHSGKKQEFPEIDRVEWFDVPSARDKIRSAQIPFLDRLQDALKGLK